MVYGCAGSGKTILMFYRISRAKYKAKYDKERKNLNMGNFALITPTDLLKDYNERVIQEREIGGIQQITPHELMQDALEEYYFGSPIEFAKTVELAFNTKEEKVQYEYDLETAESIFQNVFSLLNDHNEILNKDIKDLKLKIRSQELYLRYSWKANPKFFEAIDEGLIHEAKEELMETSLADLAKLKRKMEKQINSIRSKLNYFDFLIQVGSYDELNEQDSKTFEEEFQGLNTSNLENINKILDFVGKGYQEYQNWKKIFLEEKNDDEVDEKTIIEYTKDHCLELFSISYTQLLWLLSLKDKITKILKELESKNNLLEALSKAELADNASKNVKKETKDLKAVFKLYKRAGIVINDESPIDSFPGISTFENYIGMDKLYRFLCGIRETKKKDERFSQFVAYTIRRQLAPERIGEYPYKIETWSEAAHHLYIQEKLGVKLNQTVKFYKERFNEDPYYLFFDEVQDLSLLEVKCIEGIYPNSISHYMGDPFQCINPKGLLTLEQFQKLNNNSEQRYFELDINYRNAKDITEFVNERLEMNMEPIGLSGSVQTIRSFKELKGKLQVERNDGIAIIVKDKNNLSTQIEKELESFSEYKTYISTYSVNKLAHPVPILYSVSDVKGLEFETVIVCTKGLNKNEMYLSCTRALNNLYIFEGE